MDISPPSESFFELPYQQHNQLCFRDQFDDFENFSHHFNLSADMAHCNGSSSNEGNAKASSSRKKKEKEEEKPGSSKRKKTSSSRVLDFDEIKKHFEVTLTEAAKEMNVGLTLLKRKCRDLNIMRWPHRKLKSLKSVIDNELGLEDELGMLEKQKNMLERMPEMELSKETKKLRQSCFKANYNKKRRKQNTQD